MKFGTSQNEWHCLIVLFLQIPTLMFKECLESSLSFWTAALQTKCQKLAEPTIPQKTTDRKTKEKGGEVGIVGASAHCNAVQVLWESESLGLQNPQHEICLLVYLRDIAFSKTEKICLFVYLMGVLFSKNTEHIKMFHDSFSSVFLKSRS